MAARADTAMGHPLLDAWETVRSILETDALREPDRLLVDHSAGEVELVWEPEKLIVIVDDVPGLALTG